MAFAQLLEYFVGDLFDGVLHHRSGNGRYPPPSWRRRTHVKDDAGHTQGTFMSRSRRTVTHRTSPPHAATHRTVRDRPETPYATCGCDASPAMGRAARSRITVPVKVEPVVPVSSTVTYRPMSDSSPWISTVL